MLSADQILSLVALVNAIGGVIALIIHALRVPYRASAADEQLHAVDSMIKVRKAAAEAEAVRVPPPPPH